MQKLLIISDSISYFIFQHNKIYRIISSMTKRIRFHNVTMIVIMVNAREQILSMI